MPAAIQGKRSYIGGSWTLGRSIKIEAYGSINSDGTDVLDFYMYMGPSAATQILSCTPANNVPVCTNTTWMFHGVITCISTGGSGTVAATGLLTIQDDNNNTFSQGGNVTQFGGYTTINLDNDGVFDIKGKWASGGGNTFTVDHLFYSIIGV